MLSLIAWLIFGALIGWVASKIMNTDAQQGAVLNIVVGIIGAFIGGFLINRDVTGNVFNLWSVFTALIGAVVLLGIVNLFQRGRVR
ncbi:MAG TPA: GlsB/YeaQ/YmgE family stress response membrane protein [Herpetosiphon sp.]|uniref:Transglycosylase-associated protein n=1 Tax=Herpetosiphon aurantiacus (strain ATCC 23779 / DSM 785 / 114-95) TaxID=316274 RepID=A9AUU8_HERA2|nr:GlsB/YeaQ/YmgE family stress response membrane protein [Herpetosiphon sp.]ABX06536.1 Transglycosylase-associated protein [Herpetosiphon aurantiacus DSM 785]HBW50205.1 GlsB/YeaQ/YmgE family stress response membrane protein [Herpetosiphon sp.]